MTVPAGAVVNTGGGGQQQQPAAPHPTVPFGQNQPGAQPPAQPQIPPQFQPPAPQQPAQPHPTVPQGQQPAAPQQPQQPAQPNYGGLDPNTVIQAGPGVPPELVGRPLGQAFQIYQALAEDFVRRNSPPTQPQQQPAPQRPAAPQQPGAQPPQGQQPPGVDRDFWANPREAFKQMIREEVAPMLAPVTQDAQEREIIRARDIALAAIPDHRELWPDIVVALQNATPEALADSRVWETAADVARGRRARAGRNGQQPPAQPNAGYTAAGGRPAVPAGAPQQPVLPQFAFFSEAPTVPNNGGVQGQLTESELAAASKMNMTPQEYMSWKGGVRGR